MNTMRKLILSVVLMFALSDSFSAEIKYPVSDIPEDLKTGVNAVVREDNMTFKILSKSRAQLSVHYVVTIFNSKAKHYATEDIDYDKLRKITALKANVYDANGILIKKLKSSDVADVSAYDGFSLFSDNRIKRFDLRQGDYPYTVEIEYEMEYKYLFHISGTYLLSDEDVSVQRVTYNLIYPKSIKPRYKVINIDQQPKQETLADGSESLFWSFEKIKPIRFDPFGPSPSQIIPHILAAPSEFEYEGYLGDMNSWKDFGDWIISLNKGRDILPEATKQKVKEITRDLTSNEEKIKKLYEYMQNKTRYVSIQLGIGGYQPFEASVVDQTGYGDCKALSNYMVTLLNEVGIKSYYTLIQAGKDRGEIDVDLPSSQFNHAIVSVPNGKDTLWLECTSQTNPFGYMGTFTGDRKALIITESGGKIVNTIHYPTEGNRASRAADVYLDLSGNAKAKVKTVYSGLEYERDHLSFYLNDQYDNQKKWVLENTTVPSFDLVSFNFVNNKAKIPSAEVNLDLNLNRLASANGKRLFLTPNLMNRSTFIPEKNEERKTDLVFKWGSVNYDTIRYHIPENIYPEFLPEPVKLTSRFGEYEASFKVDQGNVVYIRKFKKNNGRFPASSYKEFSDFYRSINKADNLKIVFLNKT